MHYIIICILFWKPVTWHLKLHTNPSKIMPNYFDWFVHLSFGPFIWVKHRILNVFIKKTIPSWQIWCVRSWQIWCVRSTQCSLQCSLISCSLLLCSVNIWAPKYFVLIPRTALLHPLNRSICAVAAGGQKESQFEPHPTSISSRRREHVRRLFSRFSNACSWQIVDSIYFSTV